ncbi:hypothetical protein GF325_18950 [Candidatus Bathyarchaeota archaeon]|nr:hypothetical protein [Candidatus Bathyarchaeota archaeon]
MANADISENVSSIVNIGFDMIMGPTMRWKRDINPSPVSLDYDQFAMATYLAFKGGNEGGPRPQAIVYDGFSVVGLTRGMDLICLFLKNTKALSHMASLKAMAENVAIEMDDNCHDEATTAGDDDGIDHEEIKRIVLNMLRGKEHATPELRKCFELTNSGIWKIMSDLENDGLVKRAGKDGRAILWTLA